MLAKTEYQLNNTNTSKLATRSVSSTPNIKKQSTLQDTSIVSTTPSNTVIPLSFDGKPYPDNPDGVPRRQPDTPALQANPRTPTQRGTSFSGVLAVSENTETINELKTKDQLIEKIKEWVKIDNEIRVLQKEQKKRLADKKKVSGELMAVMKSNEIDAFDLNDGQILYDKRNQKKPITKTALLSILTAYYKGDSVKASETNQYILNNREEVVREKIVRKITKPKIAEN